MTRIKESYFVGISFGLTSAVLTTIGVIVGLYKGMHSLSVVMGGVLTVSVADALSDAMSMHVHEEAECEHSGREIWESTLATFVSKLLIGISFLIPLKVFAAVHAISICIVWGIVLLSALSFIIAKGSSTSPLRVISEHLVMAVAVIAITYMVGAWIESVF